MSRRWYSHLTLTLTLSVVAGCHSGDFIVAESEGGGGGCTGRVLFVVGAFPLIAGDSAIRDRLLSLGYSAVIVDEAALTVADATGMDFCFISRSTQAVALPGAFRDLPVPILVPEYAFYPVLGMTGPTMSTDWGSLSSTATDLQILDSAHPLAAGFSGAVTVMTPGSGLYGFGVPAASAARVASLPGQTGQYAIFAYEKGASMVGLDAPARRVGWFMDKPAATRLTPSGWALFDAAVKWTAGTCAMP